LSLRPGGQPPTQADAPTAEVENTFGPQRGISQLNAERCRDGVQRHASAGHEGFEQHVARARALATAARGGMQAGNDERFAGLDLATDPFAETPLCAQRD
jgi:hypothetical protein